MVTSETKWCFVRSMEGIFKAALPCLEESIGPLFSPLFDANYKCCEANNAILALRKEGGDNSVQISQHEWTARSVGEKRVQIKSKINHLIARAFPKLATGHWSEDDIVCSIADLVDRICIENIKQGIFAGVSEEKRLKSSDWCQRVLVYLMNKLESVRHNGYECLDEMRTYVLEQP